MSDLTTLSLHQRTVFLAEIAALLHNIGKLDPNFLMQQIREDERRAASESMKERHQAIDSYHFKRFAAPDPASFREPARSEIFQTDTRVGSTKELWQRLKKLEVWSEKDRRALQILDDADWSGKERSAHPKVSKALSSAWQIAVWLQGNGPLYIPRTAERKQLTQEIEALGQQITELNERVREAPEHEKPEIGAQLGDLRSELEKRQADLARLAQEEQDAQQQFEAQFREHDIPLADGVWSVANLLTFFWDEFFYQPDPREDRDSDYKRDPVLTRWLEHDAFMDLPGLLILSHGEVSGAEKFWTRDKQVDVEKQHWPPDYFSTAFGYERAELNVDSLQPRRFDLIKAGLAACADPETRRTEFIRMADQILQVGLGDTEWPINEITLWDYSSSIAALFKSGVARAVLKGKVPSIDEMRWRFLSVRFDGLGYLSQAHHVTDLLGRRESLKVALDGVRTLLERTYPLGNEVFRDERGTVFVVPDLPDQTILLLADESGESLETLLEREFAQAENEGDQGTSLARELIPAIRIGSRVRGKKLRLGRYLQKEPLPLTADAAKMAEWWCGEQAKGKEICTVCGVRPMGWGVDQLYPSRHVPYYRQQAKQRGVCGVCMQRRGQRARDWLQHQPDSTIWADEVVDENGRFALLVGRFGLAGWLDGSLIPSLQKPASFARVQRCWETTRDFWKEVDEEVAPAELTPRARLEIKPQNHDQLQNGLGNYHTYQLQVGGQTLSAVWDPQSQRFLLTENLDDLKRRLGFAPHEDAVPAIQRWLRNHAGAPWPVMEPSGYLSPARSTGQSVDLDQALGSETQYTPHIRLLAEPSIFMALVPADKAMEIAQSIRQKYEREMSKVQDRLPLHLGLVIARRRTPIRAVLEAGRALLGNSGRGSGAGGWQKWRAARTPQSKGSGDAPPYLAQDNRHFEEWWDVTLKRNRRETTLRVSAVMGDGETEDVWYPHLLKRRPTSGEAVDPEHDVIHVKDLQSEQAVYLAPSTFDFEYLDTTARRFEITYQTVESDQPPEVYRPTHPRRPYLLNDIDRLQHLWTLLCKHLRTSQWMQIAGLIAAKRRAWNEPYGILNQPSKTFEHFVRDTWGNAEWKRQPDEEDVERLVDAALYGLLDDVIDLYHEALKESGD